jgi:hypothetical protein
MVWRRHGLLWGRWPTLGQHDLERWTGAGRQDPLPPSLNCYLFSSFGEIGEATCLLAERSAALLTLSGITLLAGLLLIYFRVLRHPALVLAGGLAVLTLVLAYPDLALAAVQASWLGVALVASAWVWKRVVDWRQGGRTVVHGTAFASPDSKTVKAPIPLSVHLPQPPTTTLVAPSGEAVGEPSP